MPGTPATQKPPATSGGAAGGDNFDGEGSEVEGPVSSFQSYAAEGDILAKQGEFRKAIEAYTKALNMRPTEKNCLVARSKCYLQLGDSDLALQDAEAALKEDTEFFKGMYQKAEALYAKGDFEMALVFYHRGNKLRPELDEFRLGIQKAREAIDNSIGNPRDYKFKAPANFSLDATKQQMPPPGSRTVGQMKKSARTSERSTGVVVNTMNNTKKIIPRGESASSSTPERDVKQLLGELYADKEYLEQLLNDRDFINNPNDRIFELVSDGLKYLETRTEFWRQQKPIYARRKEAAAIRSKMTSARNRQLAREQEKTKDRESPTPSPTSSPHAPHATRPAGQGPTPKASPAKVAKAGAGNGGAAAARSPIKATKPAPAAGSPAAAATLTGPPLGKKTPEDIFELINEAIQAEDPVRVLELGNVFLGMNMKAVANPQALRAQVLSLMGTAELELNHYPAAEKCYLDALAIPAIPMDTKSMTLGYLGRSYAKLKKFGLAAQYWEQKLALDTPQSDVEKAWLYHDVARCYIEQGNDAKAKLNAQSAAQYAMQSKDPRWILNTQVLLGQLFAKSDPAKARAGYETALRYANELQEENAATVISQALVGLAAA
ncbi:Tetratricopeptide repeat protein 25 [Allomyces javanicus]|nr:Tetratricopeptide repeat protein 25 [Allomyces javanicus]